MSNAHVPRPLLLLAQLSPVIAAAVHAGVTLGTGGAPASVGLALVLSLVALGLAGAIRPVREFLTDLADFLVTRVPLAVFVLATLVAVLLATRPHWPPAWIAVSTWLLLLTVASVLRLKAVDPRGLVKVVALLGINFVLLVFVDWVLGRVVMPSKSHNSVFIQHDAVLGWRLRPSFQVDRRNERYRALETTSRLGFRTPDVPFEKPEGTLRIVVLGDSHTEGYTVSDGEQYSQQLAQALSPELPVEVVSLGVAGYSTDQELLCYLRYGRRFDPDLVILQFSPNDVRFNVLDQYWRGAKPRYRRQGDHLMLEGVPVPDSRQVSLTRHPLLAGSSIAMLLEGTLGRIHTIDESKDVDMEEAWTVTGLLIRDIGRAVAMDGVPLVMFNAQSDRADFDERVQEIAASHDIDFIDVSPAFPGDIVDYRAPEDTHWNQRGHAAVAAFLADALRPRLERLRPSGR